MDLEEKEKNPEDEAPEEPIDPSQLNALEKFYERFRGVPLRNLDIFIGACVAALILVIILGMLKGWGIL